MTIRLGCRLRCKRWIRPNCSPLRRLVAPFRALRHMTPPGTLQYVYIDRNGTIIPSDQTPVPVPFSALLTFVTFNGTIPQNQDIVRHVYYTNPGLVLITQVEFQYQEQCFTLIGFDTLVCWTGTDYCFYPLQLGGLNGVVVNSLSEVATYVNGVGGGPFSVDSTTGCWNRLEPFVAKKKRNAPPYNPYSYRSSRQVHVYRSYNGCRQSSICIDTQRGY